MELVDGKEHYQAIRIYYKPIEALVGQTQKLHQEMLFNFNDINTMQINKWFSSYKTYETIINLYRALFYSNRLFIETKFLNIAQALETLHSFLHGNLYLPPEEFKEKRDRILTLAPVELKDWVSGALQNANYKSFKLRIYELINNKADLFSTCINDINDFAKQVRDTRNEFVHLKKNKGSFELKGELLAATSLLTMVFETYLLELIGFSKDKVDEITHRQIVIYLRIHKKF